MHLVDAGKLVFHRVFDGNDFTVWAVDIIQHRVKGRGLAGTGWPRHQQNAVRQPDQPLERLLVVGEEPQLGQAQLEPLFVQDTHDDTFTVSSGQTRHAQINGFAADLRLDTAILRNAPLRDGHVGHDFQALKDGCLQPLGRVLHLVQHAVNAVADAEFLGQRLQMNVRSARLESVHDHGVDQLDDRRVGIDD